MSEQKKKQQLWVDELRPKTVDDIILPKRIKDKFRNNEVYANFLFAGSAGTGKTTLAKILASNYSWMLIDGSLENGVDTIREKITNYCSTMSVKGGFKIVIIDEADHLSSAAQAGMRGTIEKFSKVARFIFTCNYPEKLIEPIQKSRLVRIDFNFSKEEQEEHFKNTAKYIVEVCKMKGVTISGEALMMLMKRYYPDIRHMLLVLQDISQTNKNIRERDIEVCNITAADTELYECIIKNSFPPDIMKFVKGRYVNREHDAYVALGEPFREYLLSKGMHDKVLASAPIVTKYMYESTFVIDKHTSLLACCFELSQLFK